MKINTHEDPANNVVTNENIKSYLARSQYHFSIFPTWNKEKGPEFFLFLFDYLRFEDKECSISFLSECQPFGSEKPTQKSSSFQAKTNSFLEGRAVIDEGVTNFSSKFYPYKVFLRIMDHTNIFQATISKKPIAKQPYFFSLIKSLL